MLSTTPATLDQGLLLRRGLNLERLTLGWNVVGIVVLTVAAAAARSVGLAGFALDSLVEIGASAVVLAVGYHSRHSTLGIAWTGLTAAVMFILAAGKARTGRALDNPVLITEGRVTTIDALLACAVLLGLVLNATLGAWWADPLAGLVIAYYGLREARTILLPRSL